VPLSTLVSIKPVSGPEFTTRFNEYRAAQINGLLAPGSPPAGDAGTGRGIRANHVARHGLRLLGDVVPGAGGVPGVPASAVIGFSVLVVFLLMAALYESWTLPFAVLLATPIAMFGALGALWLRGFELDVFSQMECSCDRPRGQERDPHRRVRQGRVRGGYVARRRRARRRPCASARPLHDLVRVILGCVPLWTAAGAGAVGRRILGTVVIGGMLTDTLIASLFISVSFYVSERFLSKRKWAPAPAGALAPIQGGSLDAPVGDGGVR